MDADFRYCTQANVPGGVSCRKHEIPEAASAIWGRMLHICASRSVLLDTECTVTDFPYNLLKNLLFHRTFL
ncbi:hypothetical protein K040078D81_57650 [Blautia hominis]|uniref:Uncharacterized protein n=1 Tax=Blautia hominis TaxID=2025493 RepID=A0ABQ0BJM7_9FIRM